MSDPNLSLSPSSTSSSGSPTQLSMQQMQMQAQHRKLSSWAPNMMPALNNNNNNNNNNPTIAPPPNVARQITYPISYADTNSMPTSATAAAVAAAAAAAAAAAVALTANPTVHPDLLTSTLPPSNGMSTSSSSSTTNTSLPPIAPLSVPVSLPVPLDYQYPLSADGYDVYAEIGSGAFATVYRAVVRDTGEEVAIKVIDLDYFNTSWDEIRREISVMSLMNHPNVVKIKCSFVDASDLWIVMSLLSAGSCAAVMKQLAPTGLKDEVLIATILREVLQALQYFHKDGRIHRDVKAGNVLLSAAGEVQLGDFGVAGTLMENGDRKKNRQTFTGTPCWMAPEVMEHTNGYDEKADIWSIGITAMELGYGRAPYAKYQPMKVMLLTLQEDPPTCDIYNDNSYQFSKAYHSMISKCLRKDPKKRPSAKKLLEHKFFKLAQGPEYLVQHLIKKLPPPTPNTNKIRIRRGSSLRRSSTGTGDGQNGQSGSGPTSQVRSPKGNGVHIGSWVFDEDEIEEFESDTHTDPHQLFTSASSSSKHTSQQHQPHHHIDEDEEDEDEEDYESSNPANQYNQQQQQSQLTVNTNSVDLLTSAPSDLTWNAEAPSFANMNGSQTPEISSTPNDPFAQAFQNFTLSSNNMTNSNNNSSTPHLSPLASSMSSRPPLPPSSLSTTSTSNIPHLTVSTSEPSHAPMLNNRTPVLTSVHQLTGGKSFLVSETVDEAHLDLNSNVNLGLNTNTSNMNTQNLDPLSADEQRTPLLDATPLAFPSNNANNTQGIRAASPFDLGALSGAAASFFEGGSAQANNYFNSNASTTTTTQPVSSTPSLSPVMQPVSSPSMLGSASAGTPALSSVPAPTTAPAPVLSAAAAYMAAAAAAAAAAKEKEQQQAQQIQMIPDNGRPPSPASIYAAAAAAALSTTSSSSNLPFTVVTPPTALSPSSPPQRLGGHSRSNSGGNSSSPHFLPAVAVAPKRASGGPLPLNVMARLSSQPLQPLTSPQSASLSMPLSADIPSSSVIDVGVGQQLPQSGQPPQQPVQVGRFLVQEDHH